MKDDVQDVSDFNTEYERLSNKLERNHKTLITIGIQYRNKISGRDSELNNNLVNFTDAFVYRHNCIMFHLKYLLELQLSSLETYKKIRELDQQMFLFRLIIEMSSLFDSIIFHSISGFDYFAHLLDFICNNRLQMDRKWNGLVEAAKNSSIEFSKSPVAPILINLDNDFVNSLRRRRNQVIHYKTDLAHGIPTFDLRTHDDEFVMFAPRQIMVEIPFLQSLSETKKVTMAFVACWTVEKVFDSFADVLNKLSDHLELFRKTSMGMHFIQDKNGNFHEI